MIHRLKSTLLAASLLHALPASAAETPMPAENFAAYTADGGWCWFSDPRALSKNGKTYTGWVTRDGSIQAAELEHATGKVATFTLHAQYERDDHDNPAFLFLPDDRLMAFYSRHGGGRNPKIHSRVTSSPGDFTRWEPEVGLPLRDDSGGKAGISYCNPFLLSEENHTLYLFWRGYSYKPTIATSPDGGKTWSPAKIVFARAAKSANNRPYAKYASNGKDRIHFLFTDGHPRNEGSNSVYYACYRGGAFYKADGTRICDLNGLPIRPEQADLVYDARKTGARAWIHTVAYDAEDRPVIAYTRHPSEQDHRYHYARWNGTSWHDTELCQAGKWFPQTPAGKTEREPHYSSGLALDPSNPSIVYLTRPVNGVRELEKWTTPDGGKTWAATAITKDSKHDNVRPYGVLNHAADGPSVLWMNLHGHYTHYTDFLTSIRMDRPAKVTHEQPAVMPPLSDAFQPAAILGAMQRVADWQLEHPSRHHPTDWTQGAGYTGIMALAAISKDPKYRNAMVAMGEANEWKLGPRPYHADDHTVGQTYAELFLQLRDPKMIAPMKARFDAILAKPSQADLNFKSPRNQDRWSWCDSLFMAPPAWLRLHIATGDKRYLDFSINEWWHTSDFLYDEKAHLYFRDSNYFEKREANGQNVYWGRGNGWVMGGLVRMLQYLPKDHPARPRFEQQFKDMAAKLLTCQQDDGLWRASLLDPASYPLKETSGSGFFTYAFAWGVNEGMLDRQKFEPAIRKAWSALVSCVQTDGKLTHVQPIGEDPRKFPDDSTEIYGVGSFLLAGSEIHRMAVKP